MNEPNPVELKQHAPNLADVFTSAANSLALAALRAMLLPGDSGQVLRSVLLPHLVHIRDCANEAIKLIELASPVQEGKD